ncbi:MAG: putative inorganic carbon transporter subunit DabA [Baekduia sp.]
MAGNAAFIVGPRAMTAGLDLGRRTFLHSYDAAVDREGEALETILTAPLVVAQWINCQYYFSTVDPVVHGAGTKTIHNVVAGVGVLAGQSGDLQLGLPWQSVADGKRLVHEPMRLAAIVEAPLDRIAAIIERNEVLQRLFGGGWVALVSREGPGAPWMQYRDGAFQPWSPSGHDDEEEEAA